MRGKNAKKGLVLVVILLFVGAGVIPCISGNFERIKNLSDFKVNEKKDFLEYTPDEEWNKTFGGSDEDMAYSVQQTMDGGYILAGSTNSYGSGNFDVWLVKTDENGDEEWNNFYGGLKSDTGCSVIQTSDYGFIVLGNTLSYGPLNRNAWLIKTDSDGNEEWNKTLGGVLTETAYSFQQTNDNGYIVTGYINNNNNFDVWLIKSDSNGNQEWSKTYDRSVNDVGHSVFQTNNGGYIIVGETKNEDSSDIDVWLIKIGVDGNEQWNKTFGGANIERGHDVLQTADGGYIITGYTDSFGTGGLHGKNVWVIKTDSTGEELWNKTYGGTQNEEGNSIIQLINGGFLICGYTHSYGEGWSDVFIIKTDSSGNEVWSKTVGGAFWESGESVRQTDDEGFIIAGMTDSFGNGEEDFWLIKIAFENQPPSAPEIEGPTSGKDEIAYPYTFTSIDPDEDQVSYYIRWGDGTITDWTEFQNSGPPGYTESRSWSTEGEYTIAARAKDEHDTYSNWTELDVEIPRYKAVISPLFHWFLERYSLLERLLSSIRMI